MENDAKSNFQEDFPPIRRGPAIALDLSLFKTKLYLTFDTILLKAKFYFIVLSLHKKFISLSRK